MTTNRIGPTCHRVQPNFGPNGRQKPDLAAVARLQRQKYWIFIHYHRNSGDEGRIDEAYLIAENEELPSTPRRRLEAALFLSKEGLSSRKLAKLAGLADATEARTLIRQLNQEYDEEGRVFRVEEVAGGYIMMTRGAFADWLRKMGHVSKEQRLTQSAIETLAIVAYRQPVLRAEIEAIRGVGCSEVLKQLMELELVRISGRSEDLGRPYLYGTTRIFLQRFGLRSVDRLPRVSWVNESKMSYTSNEIADPNSELEESPVSLTATALLEDVSEEEKLSGPQIDIQAVDEEEEEEGWMDDEDEDEEWADDDDWADDEEDEDEGEESLDDDEDEGEWEEVGDDDDGWVDDDEDESDDDDDDDDDDWGDDDEEEDWD